MNGTAPSGIVTLLTDFGVQDHYVGVIKGEILRRNPRAVIVDITHQVPPQDVQAAAWLLASSWRSFPAGTVHLCVVDPGVGDTRKALAAEVCGHRFVGPDNGFLTHVLRDCDEWKTRELSRGDLFNQPVSMTFHGRDIFAPIAGALSANLRFDEVGSTLPKPVELDVPTVGVRRDEIRAGVVYIDRFGNVITAVTARHLEWTGMQPGEVVVAINDAVIDRYYPTYAVAGNGPFFLFSSGGWFEVAVKNGSAAEALNIRRGDPVVVRRRA
jgi:S-adenosylmethionine hydrolase